MGWSSSTSDVAHEVRLALRQLFRRPGFATVAIVTLALGIGAPTAIFSVVHAVLLRDLPYPAPDHLVQFRLEGRGVGKPLVFEALPAATALQWAAQSTTLSGLALYTDSALTLTTADGPFRLTGVAATPNLFDVLGVRPAVGTTFDSATTDTRRVVLSYDTWQRHFGGSVDAVGSTTVFNEERYLITAVMPRNFGFPTPEAAFWTPMIITDAGRGMMLPAVARLQSGATPPAVVEEGRRWLEEAEGRARWTLSVRTIYDQLVGGVRRLVWILMGAVAFVCAIATANIALLLMTRGTGRVREFSIRLALGAARERLARQLFIEGLTLAVVGCAAGVGLAGLFLQTILGLAPANLPRLQESALNGPALTFAFVLTIFTSLVFGVLSAGPAVSTDPVRSLGRLGGETHDGLTRLARRRLSALAAAELALTMVLLVGAGLLIRSFARVLLIDQGFAPSEALALQISLPSATYSSPDARLAFHERLLEGLNGLNGIASSGLIVTMPNRQPSARMDFSATEILPADPFTRETIPVRTASEGFFEAMGIRILGGRGFRLDDRPGSEQVVVISTSLARREFGDRNPIGEMLFARRGAYRVVGLVGDVRPAAEGEEIGPAAYRPIRQDQLVFRFFATATVVVRGRHVAGLVGSLRSLVLSLDPAVPPFNIRTLSDEVAALAAGPRFSAAVLAAFAAIALLLAAIGVYGVMTDDLPRRAADAGDRRACRVWRDSSADPVDDVERWIPDSLGRPRHWLDRRRLACANADGTLA